MAGAVYVPADWLSHSPGWILSELEKCSEIVWLLAQHHTDLVVSRQLDGLFVALVADVLVSTVSKQVRHDLYAVRVCSPHKRSPSELFCCRCRCCSVFLRGEENGRLGESTRRERGNSE